VKPKSRKPSKTFEVRGNCKCAEDSKLWVTEQFEPLFEPWLRTDFEVVGTDPKYNRPTNKNPKSIEPAGKPELIPAD